MPSPRHTTEYSTTISTSISDLTDPARVQEETSTNFIANGGQSFDAQPEDNKKKIISAILNGTLTPLSLRLFQITEILKYIAPADDVEINDTIVNFITKISLLTSERFAELASSAPLQSYTSLMEKLYNIKQKLSEYHSDTKANIINIAKLSTSFILHLSNPPQPDDFNNAFNTLKKLGVTTDELASVMNNICHSSSTTLGLFEHAHSSDEVKAYISRNIISLISKERFTIDIRNAERIIDRVDTYRSLHEEKKLTAEEIKSILSKCPLPDEAARMATSPSPGPSPYAAMSSDICLR